MLETVQFLFMKAEALAPALRPKDWVERVIRDESVRDRGQDRLSERTGSGLGRSGHSGVCDGNIYWVFR